MTDMLNGSHKIVTFSDFNGERRVSTTDPDPGGVLAMCSVSRLAWARVNRRHLVRFQVRMVGDVLEIGDEVES